MKARRIILWMAAASFILCSGCQGTAPQLLNDYGSFLDQAMTSKNPLSRLEGAAEELCVIEDEGIFSEDEIEAPAAGLFNITDQKTLYSKNANEEMGIASITKIMTALVAMKYGDLDKEVTISFDGSELGGNAVLCGFVPGDKILLSSLLSASLIYSGNDAAIDVAIAVSGSQDAFVELMNQECKTLMTSHTHFANATGLQQSKHYSSVYDVYLMFQECLKYQTFRNIIARGSFLCYYTNAAGENVTKNFNSTNLYLTGQYTPPDGISVIGGKTGHTNQSGYSLVLLAEDSHHKEYIAVILGAQTRDELYKQMSALLSKIS